MNVKTYSEKERRCNASFLSAGPYWHAYTSGKETPLLFSCTQDFAFAMNVVAQASNEFKGVTILAFEILNNHFHFVCPQKNRKYWNSGTIAAGEWGGSFHLQKALTCH